MPMILLAIRVEMEVILKMNYGKFLELRKIERPIERPTKRRARRQKRRARRLKTQKRWK